MFISKRLLFHLVLILICLSTRVAVATPNWMPSALVHGNATAGADLHCAKEGGACTTWFWEFHNRYPTRITIRYTWSSLRGTEKNYVTLEPKETSGSNNACRATFPAITITAVEFGRAQQNGSSGGGVITNGDIKVFPVPTTTEGAKVFPGPRTSPSPKN